MRTATIAIVGAGLAGLKCASLLIENGLKVTIFDKGRFVGGRIASRNREAQSFDYGAQYFTAKDIRFRSFLAKLMRENKVARWRGKFGKMEHNCLVEEQNIKPRYVGMPLMRTIAESLKDKVDCRMLHRVTKVSKRNGKWLLSGVVNNDRTDEEFESSEYDFLVLNMPPAQAIALYTYPLLSSLTLTACCSLMLSFSQRLDIDFDGIRIFNQPLSWVARDSSKPGREPGERWVIHASSLWSEENFPKNSDEIAELLSTIFAGMFDITLPPPLFVKAHKWRYALPIVPLDCGHIIDKVSSVAFCGDWCQGARVEGAFLSGYSVAQEIIQIARSV